MDDAIASLHGLTLRLGTRVALADITLSVAAGECLAVVGPNGAGKSTLLRALAGDLPTGGAARLRGEDPATLPSTRLAAQRAFLEQAPSCAWGYSALEVAALGSNESAAGEALRVLGLGALADRRIDALSGGEQRLVHLARCLGQLGDSRGKLLLLDEPTASLDPARGRTVLAAARRVAEQGGAVIVATHDLGQAALCDRVAVLAEGHLRAIGKPAETLVPAVTRSAWGLGIRVARDGEGRVTVTSED
jgi:iron complex transport system ATP-binding protein